MRIPNIVDAIIPRRSLFLITAALLLAGGVEQALAADGVAVQPATQPVQLQLAAERVEGLGQPPDTGRTAVIVHPGGGGAVSLPIVADTYLWKESANSSGTGGSILLRDNRFSQGLVRIDPQGIDGSASFTASFHFKVGGVERKGQPATISLHRVLTDWSEDATWFSPRPDQGRAWNGLKPGMDYEQKPLAEWQTPALTDNQVVDIEGLGPAVKAWRNGGWPNYGILVLLNGKALQCTFPSREKSLNVHVLGLGGETAGALLIAPNAGVLSKVLLRPDCLADAALRLGVRKPAKAAKGAAAAADVSIEVLRALRPITDHSLAAGVDFDASPIARCSVPMPVAGSTIVIPGLADALRHIAGGGWNNDGLIVRLTTAGAPALAIAGPGDAKNAPSFTITLAPATHALLYGNDVKPRPGVYTTLKNGHLYYGDERLRLWGTVGAPHADRLIKMGFNAERIWDPRVILNKNAPGFYTEESLKRGEPAEYKRGDGSMIDRWDQHFADDKAHGIFIMLAALQNGMPVIPLAADDSFIAPGHDPGSDAGDWEGWKKAVLTPKVEPMLAKIAVIDDRLLTIRKRAARNLLQHVNQYTGKPCGEDEAVAVYEVFNENGFARAALEGDYEKWPRFFQEEFRLKWNAWLKSKYSGDAALTASWGRIDAGESLGQGGAGEQGTVRLGPTLPDRASFPTARASDFVRFVIETDHHFQEEFRAYCRTLAPAGVGVNVAPFSFDSQYRPHLAWNYTNSLADVNCFGMYFWDLSSSLTRPPSAYVIDSNTTEGSATILYETNCGRPDPYRAEYPVKCAALASWQDWDGVFWHYWSENDEPDESYLTTPMAPPVTTHYWSAVQHQNDPVMCSAMSIAGRMFLNHNIHPAPGPAIFEVGAKALFGYDRYNGVGVAAQTFTRGARIRYEPDKPIDVLLDGAPPPQPERITGAVASGDEILWDWPNGRLIIDTPTSKACVGKISGPFKFRDGIVLGDVSTPFVSFAMASGDGKPLTGADASKRIYVAAVADARNTGFKFNYEVKGGPLEQAGAVSSRGRAPVIVDKVTYTVWFPTNLDGTFSEYDFALRSAASQALAGTNRFSQAEATPYMSVLSIDRRGSPAAVPEVAAVATASGDNVQGSAASPRPLTTAPVTTGPWNPVPGLSWNMGYAEAQRALRGSNLAYIAISSPDLTDAAAKTITLSDARPPSLWNSAVDLEVSFAGDHMGSITATFKQPPPFADAAADFQKQFGAPTAKQAGAQFERNLAHWENVDQAVNITMTESQGVLKIVFEQK